MKNIFKAFLYSFCFFILPYWLFYYFYFHFNLININEYIHFHHQFKQNAIILKTTKDFIFLIGVILFIPFSSFIYLIFLKANPFNKIKMHHAEKQYLHLTKKILNKDLFQNKKKYAPMPLYTTSFTAAKKKNIAPIAPIKETAPPQTLPQSIEIPVPPIAQDVEMIIENTKSWNLGHFKNLLLDGHRVHLSLATDQIAVLFHLMNVPDTNWAIEMDEKLKPDSSWFSEAGIIVSPAIELLAAKKALEQKEPNAKVIAAILMVRGYVLEGKATQEILKKQGVELLQLDELDIKGIPTLSDFLNTTFGANNET